MQTNSKRNAKHLRDYDRSMLRSQFASLFWSVITERRKRGFKLRMLADALGKDKSVVSRWFSGEPNWTLNTISDIAGALDLELHIEAKDRKSGQVFSAHGVVSEGQFAQIRTGTVPNIIGAISDNAMLETITDNSVAKFVLNKKSVIAEVRG